MIDKHAANKALYAIDAEHNLRPFLFWQLRYVFYFTGEWVDCTIGPSWSDTLEYRRKDDAPDYGVNDMDCPASLQEIAEAMGTDNIKVFGDIDAPDPGQHYRFMYKNINIIDPPLSTLNASRPDKNSIEETLLERGSRYGDFKEHARITQNLKKCLADSPNWATMRCDQKEALEMVMHKVGRILNGDPCYIDSYRDIIGYVKLVIDQLLITEGASDSLSIQKELVNGSWSEVEK